MEDETRLGSDPKPYILATLILFLLELIRRAFLDYVPTDFTAYLSAADAFTEGLNPYTQERSLVPRYQGFPYNYLPGSLYLIQIFSYFSSATILAVDWIARALCLFGVVRILSKHIFPDLKLSLIILCTLFFQPLGVDLLFGNIVTYLFSAFIFSYAIAQKKEYKFSHFVYLFIFGIVIAFKPFWAIPVGFLLLSFNKYKLIIAFLSGLLVLPLLTIPLMDWVPAWLKHTSKMREYYYSVDFLNLAPPLLILSWCVGIAIAIYFLRRGRNLYNEKWLWLLGCVSIPMWPRLATYSYVITLPLVLFFFQRWGWKKGLLFSLVVGPFAWILRILPILPNHLEEQWAQFIWIFIAAFFLIRELRILGEKEHSNHPSTEGAISN